MSTRGSDIGQKQKGNGRKRMETDRNRFIYCYIMDTQETQGRRMETDQNTLINLLHILSKPGSDIGQKQKRNGRKRMGTDRKYLFIAL